MDTNRVCGGVKALAVAQRALIAWVLIMFGTGNAIGQSDAVKVAGGRTALDNKDCPAALRAFDGVSVEGRSNPVWIIYMARTEECVLNFGKAVEYYERYDQMVPEQAEVLNKIGELRYRITKDKEAAAAREVQLRQSAAEAERRAAEQRKQQQNREDVARALSLRKEEAIRNYSQNTAALVSAFNRQVVPKQLRVFDDQYVTIPPRIEGIDHCTMTLRTAQIKNADNKYFAWTQDLFFIKLQTVDLDSIDFDKKNFFLNFSGRYRKWADGKQKWETSQDSVRTFVGPAWEGMQRVFEDLVMACAAKNDL